LLCVWFASRVLVLGISVLSGLGTQSDVFYYFDHINALGASGPAQTMPEYPIPAVWLLAVPWLLGLGRSTGYVIAFACLMLALDAAFTYTLWRTGGRRRSQAVLLWTVFLMLIGPTAYMRFDLIVSVMAGWALLAMRRRRPGIAGALIGVGAAVKLWPALLWPALCGLGRRTAVRATAAFGVVGLVAAGAAWAWAGWDRLVSPLVYQSDRGLQIESVFASVPMLLRGLGLGDFAVTLSRYQAFEIWGTGVQLWLRAASVAVYLGYGLILVAYAAWLWRGHGRLDEAAVLVLLAITTLIVTNKTFSPQYVIWLGAPLAAAVIIIGDGRPRLRRLCVLVLAMTLATLLVYPLGYTTLVRDAAGWTQVARGAVTVVLVARNAMLVWIEIQLIRWAYGFLKPGTEREVLA